VTLAVAGTDRPEPITIAGIATEIAARKPRWRE
jgi:hypothetical protein